MNRLRESKDLSNDAKWRLAAAYALAGKKKVAEDIAKTANYQFHPSRSRLPHLRLTFQKQSNGAWKLWLY